mmetsp:Transcript_14140/g.42766  ORF Transcript_14140/g.42766 Transcript_14140/m.42766 type:complete len:569 (-) Transcript_14140:359-2065(-)|eukprot:CAMPEP_0198671110 /NCGR_PEP_ID=MMETSP1467-20131203/84535_1 /TAXON_ID=1462469 /ORGANISM="unid. sp., Strain CCMP2135" /LENGTH=568 /DNA_ID=CAMNT_0044407901 /DNA_START=79 /DNA_END=1785 /DNA_ORIENTATION=-
MSVLFDEYRVLWCLHQLLPYVDKVLNISGTMDFRPIRFENDVACRLPLVLACLFLPSSRRLLMLAHVANVVSWSFWMPAVWDHMVWCALLEMVFVVAALVSDDEKSTMAAFLPSMRASLIILYFSAAFWKLTTSFLDPVSSCANTLVAELAAAMLSPAAIPAESDFAKYLMLSAPAQIIFIEFLVPVMLWLAPRPGIPVALLFHQAINWMPVTYAGGFSIAMCSRLLAYQPGCLAYAWDKLRAGELWSFAMPVTLVSGIAAVYLKCHDGKIDASGFAFFAYAVLYLRSVLDAKGFKPQLQQSITAPLTFAFGVVVAFTYGFLAPIFGVMAMASSTMYGNVKQFGGATNHLLVPTGLVQDLFADATPTPNDWVLDAFAGGVVRVDRYNSTQFYDQLDGADISPDQPVHARAILAATGSSGKYYEFYAKRNYYDRHDDHQGTALVKFDDLADETKRVAFALPAYELRRLLALARNREVDYFVEYTRLPSSLHTLTEWRDYKAPARVRFDVHDGVHSCVLLKDDDGDAVLGPCASDELALLKPPPKWLRSLLHPYPLPLLTGVGDHFVCTT